MTWNRLITEMSTAEFTCWVGFYQRENRERERAVEDAQDKAEARVMARKMAGLR